MASRGQRGEGQTGGYSCLPNPRGAYDPDFEKDSCGVGFVARLDAVPTHALVEESISVLVNLKHRGAMGGDRSTGDGAGLLMQMPDRFFRQRAGLSFDLPPSGEYAVGMFFMPSETAARETCQRAVENAAHVMGASVLGWRDVPVDPSCLGDLARNSRPAMRQAFMHRGSIPAPDFERRLYVIRRAAENQLDMGDDTGGAKFYCASLSSQSIVYKGLLTGTQLRPFFLDLGNDAFESAYAIVHERYSTNTLPAWRLAQPFRYLAHNGEINTLRGNINRMRAREATLKSVRLGADIDRLKPVLDERGSDSAILDNALELLVAGGRSLPHSMMMLVPEAWGQKIMMSEGKRAFYEYHSSFMEPWDGPAALVFTDGRFIGATLDRNGLRPARYTVTADGLIVLASESGTMEIEGRNMLQRGRLQPGRMLLVDLHEKRIVPDHEIKAKISRQRPYRNWVKGNGIELRGFHDPAELQPEPAAKVRRRQHAFGYDQEELKMVIAPMAAHGQEAVGSMGNDAPLAVLSEKPQLLFSYFKQLFAQVTNPPIDPLREELVMSLMSFIGRERNLLEETPEHCRMLKLHHPVLTSEDVERLRKSDLPEVKTKEIDILFPAGGDGKALEASLERVFQESEKAISEGATILLLTDRRHDSRRAPIPSMLAGSGLHHHLIRRGLRTSAGIVIETGEAREVIHFAMLIAYGVNAVCPHVAYSTIRELAADGLLEAAAGTEVALDNYITAVKKGLLKTFSRMGISTIRSFLGAQIFEAVGLGRDVIEKYFPGTVSRIGGMGLDEIAAETNARHRAAFPQEGSPSGMLDIGGRYHWRAGGERHLWTPEAITFLHRAVRENNYGLFKEYSRRIDDQSRRMVTLRGLMRFEPGKAIPIEEVEPVEEIVKRFVVAAMSMGAISREAHETIAAAANRIGARSNSGEGGEDPARNKPLPNGDLLQSKVKQVASGRFGVTTEYLLNCEEIQIKIAQGAKPGEGGQLPGYKVTEEIARVRHTTQGVTLISPPPHHDIYSIEDLSQLVYDLKCVNPAARVSVKLVSEIGVGTIASGVAKARADMVLVSGHDGGTGAAPLTSIKHAGLPWELGLAETQAALRASKLRDRIRVQVDGQLRTGRDLAVAALLGGEEFGFGTVILVAMGCTMMRKCHLNTCPFGIATQSPALREKFVGKPEHVINFLRFIAMELRENMAMLGFRTMDEMTGHGDRLAFDRKNLGGKPSTLDLSPLLSGPQGDVKSPLRCHKSRFREPVECFDDELIKKTGAAVKAGKPVRLDMPIRNIHRAVGARLSGEIVKIHGPAGLPEGTVRINFTGSAGQSFGAFLAPGVSFRVEGDVNDFLGKGMTGGHIEILPPPGSAFVSKENVIAGNVILYGATGGEIFINGIAGERFCVRNSGALAIVEGIGDHGCEYMTGGCVVVLGPTGNNFAAGMSGGIAYVYDRTDLFDTRCNLDMVDLEGVHTVEDVTRLKTCLEKHWKFTGSQNARMILDNWATQFPYFVKVMPVEYRRVLERMGHKPHREDETLSATEEVYTK
jgi:glutamate synthase domain-containing protein 2/glutamate synthase domain-containing protein 1/glutamate synthase domain-containing protein 3